MKLIKKRDVYVALSEYHERHIPKSAGFLWHGGSCWSRCAACDAGVGRVWWTKKIENAAKIKQYASAALKAELEAFLKQREESVAMSKATDAEIQIPAPPGLNYYPFQRVGIGYSMERMGVLIADEMGLGKTVQALGVINADDSIRTVLILCPATVRLNWRREAERWLVRDFRIQVIEGREIPDRESDIVIVNYDKLHGERGKALREELFRRQWDMLICDESHYLKNRKAARTKIVLGSKGKNGLVDRARRKVFLTGTPILNRPVEIYPILSVIQPKEFGNFWAFTRRYCNGHYAEYGYDCSGASNLEELQERLRATCMVRRLKKDVLRELPPKVRQVVSIPPGGAKQAVERERKAFEKFQNDLLELRADVLLAQAAGLEAEYREAVRRLQEGLRHAFGEISRVRREVAVAKVPAVLEHVDDLLENSEKVIVWAHHHEVIDKIFEHYKDRAVKVDGRTPAQKRDEAVRRFQEDPSIRVFIGGIHAAGVGITLTSARTVVFAELDWVPAWVTQAEDRAHRIGQEDSVLVQHLVLDGSLDARIAKVLIEKQEIYEKALDVPEASIPVFPAQDEYSPGKSPAERSEFSDEVRQAAHEGLRILAGICDGAKRLDGMGFNKLDARIGKSLAEQTFPLTDGQVRLAKKILPKYHRQIPARILEVIR